MLSQEQLDRINALANKSKVEPLSEAETAEQKELRAAYLASIPWIVQKPTHGHENRR
ncbi:DUF896 domain-containing protein [Exiguobacterium sp. SL14]|nr:DUF896 domain-containing protein [Exiguobacterium sp. SL14]